MDDMQFGNALVARGMLTEEELREALWERERMANLGRKAPFLWDIVIQKGFLNRMQVDEMLASMQNRRRFCERCNVFVAVPTITEKGECCGRCGGPVSWPTLAAAEPAPMDTMTLIGGEMPEEVAIARKEPSRLLGKYILVEEAGRGGAGIVFKAWDTVLGQYVALKLIRRLKEGARVSREQLIKDLLREARNSIRLRHANIVPVFDAGRIGEEFYISMEYVEGDSLAAHLRAARTRGCPTPLYEDPVHYLEIMRDVIAGVHYAHTFPKPIVHCDLKPGNILIDARGHPYIVDFGLAQPADLPEAPDTVEKGHVRGTPAYMAPEQLTGHVEEIGPWTDIYALGAILYELITGRPVFQGTAYEIMMKAMRDAPQAPLAALAAAGGTKQDGFFHLLPYAGKLEALCLKCLEKDRRKRPQAAQAICDELGWIIAALRATKPAAKEPEAPKAGPTEEQLTSFNLEEAFEEVEEADEAWDAGDPAVIATDRGRQLSCIESLKKRMVARINEHRPKLSKLTLLDRTVEQVEFLRATRKMVVVFDRGKSVELVWAAIPPQQFVELAADALKLDEPRDRLALGIYCCSARLNEVAKTFFVSLAGTPLERAAEAFLSRLTPA